MIAASRIRLTARWREPDNSYEGRPRVAVADFTLGLGTCGKVVSALHFVQEGDWITVRQYTTCGEVKDFLYHARTLEGRAEVTRI